MYFLTYDVAIFSFSALFCYNDEGILRTSYTSLYETLVKYDIVLDRTYPRNLTKQWTFWALFQGGLDTRVITKKMFCGSLRAYDIRCEILLGFKHTYDSKPQPA